MKPKKFIWISMIMILIFLGIQMGVLSQEEVWFNGLEVGAYYRWSVSGGAISMISISVDDMYVEEDYTLYYLTYRDSSRPDGVPLEVNLTWEEDVMLLLENVNISLPNFAIYLWWNASLLEYAKENRTAMEYYNISSIEYRDIMYGFSPRKTIVVQLNDAEILVDMGTGVALYAVIGEVSLSLVETNMIWRHAILLSIILLVILCVLSIVSLRVGIRRRGERK